MKKQKREIPVYSDDKILINTTLTVLVDDAGEEWLTPEQVEELEAKHYLAKYESYSFTLEPPEPIESKSSDLDIEIITATV